MYLIETKMGNIKCINADEVKNISKKDVINCYALIKVEYDDLVSTSDIRDCIYNHLKRKQMEKDLVISEVSEILGIKRNEVSKMITTMIKEKIIYKVNDDFFHNWIGID